MKERSIGRLQADPFGFIAPVSVDRHGPMFALSDINAMVIGEISLGIHFQRRARTMTKQIEEATQIVEGATALFSKSFDRFMDAEKRAAEAAKLASGRVRKSANELHEGIQKIDKVANFDKLERQVAILERAAKAMQLLADLDRSGDLQRISSVLRA